MLRKTFENFIDAVKSGNVGTVEKHWQKEWIEKADNGGRRPLHWACERGRADIVRLFLDRGCDKEAADEDGCRPIHFASQKGNVDVVQLLLDKFCDKEAAAKNGCQPIHFASHKGHVDVLTILLDRHCDIEAADEDGCRPIHLACAEGHAEIVNLLVQKGCVIDARTKNGDTPLTFATQARNDECVQIINKAQEERKRDEFQIFHLPTFSIVSWKHKIRDLPNAVEKIKTNIPCINRPVVVCHRMDPIRRLAPSQKAFRMVGAGLKYAEYFIEDTSGNQDWQSQVEELRDWDVCVVAVNMSTSEINLQINRPADQSKWRLYATVSLDVLNEQSQIIIDTVDMLIIDNARGADVKAAFVDFQRFAYCGELFESLDGNQAVSHDVRDLLNKRMMTRMDLLTFYDSNREKVTDSIPINEISTERDGCRISVVQNAPKQTKFIQKLSKSQLTKKWIAEIVSEENILIRCITDDDLGWLILRRNYKTVADVEKALRSLVLDDSEGGRLMLVGADGQLSSDTEIDKIDSVIHYAVVLPFEENVMKTRCIGSGGYGSVWQCKIRNEKIYAMKEIVIFENESEDERIIRIKELMIASRIRSHPNVVKYRWFFEEDYAFYIVMDCMKESLDSHIRNKRPLEEEAIILFARKILEGLKHLHDEKVIHRNVKCQNVLVDENGCVKLCDFGVSKYQNVDTNKAALYGGITQVGTHRYMAPELIGLDRPEAYGQSADVWSFGLVMVKMITGSEPFPDLSDVQVHLRLQKYKKVEYEFPPMYSTELKQFVDSCLVYDPHGRPTCGKLLQNIIFAKNGDKTTNSQKTKLHEANIFDSNSIASPSTENVRYEIPMVQQAPKQNLSHKITIRRIPGDGLLCTVRRSDCKTVADIENVLRPLVLDDDKIGRLMLVGADGQLPSDTEIVKLGLVIHCAVVLPFENINKLGYIGRGSYGNVSKCQIGHDETIYAMKEMAIVENCSDDSVKCRINEMMVAARIGSHPNVVEYRRFFEDKFMFYIVMDCMEMSLDRFIKNNHPLDETTIIFFSRQTLEGLKHLHDKKIIHRDIKCKNMLVDKNGCVKLCDFGVSKCQNVETCDAGMLGGSTQIGTHRYMAPELLGLDRPDQYGQKADIWGFGVMMVEMITGKVFYPGLSDIQMHNQISKDKRVVYELPQMYSRELKDFVDSCLVFDPARRPMCDMLLRNKIFAVKTEKATQMANNVKRNKCLIS